MLATTPEFSSASVLVVGDVMLDRYWSGKAGRISPEAPVPVVQVKNIEDRVGGAANVALNIAKLGGKVTLLGVVGDDEEGRIIKQLLETGGVRCELIVVPSLRSICKLRIIARNQQLIRIDFEETPLDFDTAKLANRFAEHLASHNVAVFSDYGKGTLRQVQELIALAKKQQIKVLIDPKGLDYQNYAFADLITPNLSEFQAVMGACESEEQLLAKGRELLTRLQIPNLLITRGEAGMTLIQQNRELTISAQAKDVFDVTGAGDTVIAVVAASISVGMDWRDAMYLGNLAGGIVVGKLGTSTVSREELIRAMHGEKSAQYGIVSEEELSRILAMAKVNGEKIIMTNGCFDILHIGHITYLEQARALGDRLCVAVNADESVKKLKGNSRPINGLQERMAILSALSCVDWVVAFSEETPERLYCRLLPDVIVKGGDYLPEQVVGGDCVIQAGGEVKILPFVEGHSTTNLIEKSKLSADQ
ncbi:MAG: bifunctional D-glycero-beta-D-manno-heptose-7-phosphate kinase/D-glycero-beta-D-manno-heptose 1-phosphate adenylyltransferase HldE [Gammaproteobacteria bacterium]|nr:bifunctional D-glycero-beta-D-manno-heptose-7-phosphate kinase/D-glycero-beta-D-manno-heptose 1-phosphate adenylyltransferase HldE [Gammaproteobacteria bacterium]